MGTLWGGLYVLGLVMPLLLAAASFVFVYRLAKRLRLRDPSARRPSEMLGLHLAVIVLTALLARFVWLGIAELLGIAVVPVYLFRRLRRTVSLDAETRPDEVANVGGDAAPAAPHSGVDARGVEIRRSTATRVAWFIGISGVLLPWIVGLGVKVYLQSQGKPTLPIRGFLDPASIAVLLLLTMVMWSSPFLVLAALVALRYSLGGSRRYSFRYRLPPVWWTYGAGVAAALVLFADVFWQFESIMLLVPLCLYIIPPMVLAFWMAGRFTHP